MPYKFSDNLSEDELKNVADDYEKLIHEHAHLVHFKEVATKHLTTEQLESIEEEMNDIPETNY
jgi:F0F1-type ATP synthase delta subunit